VPTVSPAPHSDAKHPYHRTVKTGTFEKTGIILNLFPDISIHPDARMPLSNHRHAPMSVPAADRRSPRIRRT